MMPLPSHGRFDFSPIVDRPDYSWPGGKRLALWVAINVESFGFGLEGPVLGNPLPMPDQRNWSWREYGNRVGIWRMTELLDAYPVRPTVSLNLALLDQRHHGRGRGHDLGQPNPSSGRNAFFLLVFRRIIASDEECGSIGAVVRDVVVVDGHILGLRIGAVEGGNAGEV